jgi:hypothetical protein
LTDEAEPGGRAGSLEQALHVPGVERCQDRSTRVLLAIDDGRVTRISSARVREGRRHRPIAAM